MLKYCSSRVSVGCSNIRVSPNSTASPSCAASRLRNSTAPSESRPASINGASADTPGTSSLATARTAAATFSELPTGVAATGTVGGAAPPRLLSICISSAGFTPLLAAGVGAAAAGAGGDIFCEAISALGAPRTGMETLTVTSILSIRSNK